MSADIPDLTPDEARARIAAGARLIDVREPDEYAAERIAGSELRPLSSLAIDALAREPGPLILTCLSGGRARRAAAALKAAGADVATLQGALLGWKAAGLPTEGRGGHD